ncbi:MAG: FAD-binding protein, partial [Gorillibacterium sp.]|nr:FAD-binding protein [Gorillibacterium sp.]
LDVCPFNALEELDGKVVINSACKMCKLCVRKGPAGVMEIIVESVQEIDKSAWKGIAVYVDHTEGEIHPVTYELIGKARELADKTNQPVYAVFMGNHITEKSHELLHYSVDEVFVYDDPALNRFKLETYTSVFEDFIKAIKPSSILVGATIVGRQLAPRVAARFRTGLTADCTVLEIEENTDLIQIRPAFGGNIMAQIWTPNNRPQMATVRYKVMNAPEREQEETGKITNRSIASEKLHSKVKSISVMPKEKEKTIDGADVLIVAGRGVKKQEDLALLQQLADLLGAEIACTRPLAESGWIDAKRQVGLSGRTVRPKLIITCGVSGAIQFVAGMNNSEQIIAINNDPKATIFKVAHYGLVGDIYEIVPKLIQKIKAGKELTHELQKI